MGDTVAPRPSVLLVHEKALICEALRIGLEECNLSVVGTCDPGPDATDLIRSERPDVVAIVEGADGAALLYARDLKASSPDVRIVLVSPVVRPDAAHFKDLGLDAVIGTHLGLVEFARVIRAVAMDMPPLAPAAPVMADTRGVDRVVQLMASTLTRREREVLELLAAGATSEQLSEELSLSPHTVRTHIQNIMSKLQVHSRLEAATFAVRCGIVTTPSKDRLAG
jgi:two-component system nitrate/nitrite response regulator NarL